MSRMRDDEYPRLKYGREDRKPAELERWLQLMALKVASVHPHIRDYWNIVQVTASAAYDQYLYLGPMQKSLVKPDTQAVPAKYINVEMRMRPLVLHTLPAHVQSMALSTRQSTVVELIFSAMVDAGPGTRRDREVLHKAVAAAPSSEVKDVFTTLQTWRFDYQRLVRLGMQPPDPSLQVDTLRAMVKKMAEKDQAFQYRLHAYQMNTGMFGMVTQTQVDEFWKFLSSEAREVQGPTNADPHAKSLDVKGKGKGDKGGKGKGDQGDQGGKGGKGKDKDKGKQVCNYFLTESGCSKGGQCGFMHSKLGIKDGRCFNCGATGHQTKECPRPRAAPKAAPKAAAAATAPTSTRGPTAASTPASASASSTAPTATGQVASPAPASISSGDQAAQLVAATVKALMSLDVPEVQAKTIEVKVEEPEGSAAESVTVAQVSAQKATTDLLLADSGASHEVRSRGSTPPQNAQRVDLALAVGSRPGWLDQQGVVWVEGDQDDSSPLMPLGKYINDLDLVLTWSSEGASLRTPQGREFHLVVRNNLPYVTKKDFEVLKSIRASSRWGRLRKGIRALVVKLRNMQELQAHREGGHQRYSPQCPECVRAKPRQRAHYRRDPTSKPGGELSVDISGPHCPGRWPTDAVKHRDLRAKYWLVGVYTYFTEEELLKKKQMEDEARQLVSKSPDDEAAELFGEEQEEANEGQSASSSAAPAEQGWTIVNHEEAESAHDAEEEPPARAETGRVLYFVEPLTSRQSTEVLPAIEKMVNQINLEFKGNVVSQVVYRLHGDKAPELTGLRAKEWGRTRGIVVTSTAAYEPNANGRAERAIGLIKEQTRAMVIGSALNEAQELWPLAVKHAAFMQRAHELGWHRSYPVWGAPVVAKIKNMKSLDSFEPRGRDGYFVGASEDVTAGALIMHVKDDGERIFGIYSSYTVVQEVDKEAKPVDEAKPAEEKPAEAASPAEEKPAEAASPAKEQPAEEANQAEEEAVEPVSDEVTQLQGDSEAFGVPETDDEDFDEECRKILESFKANQAVADEEEEELTYLGAPKDSGAEVVPLKEVRQSIGKDREEWKEAMHQELQSLTQAAMEAVPNPQGVNPRQVVPMKLVCTLKPTDDGGKRKKVRGAVCGNFIEKHAQELLYTANADITAVRTVLAVSAARGWGLSMIDVATAFLNAELDEGSGPIYVRPPAILAQFGLLPPDTLWRVRRAVYGLRAAPRSWGRKRDKELSQMKITIDGEVCRLVQSTVDASVWCIVPESEVETPLHTRRVLGYLLSYVDDFLIAGADNTRDAVCDALKSIWSCKSTGSVRYGSRDEATYLSSTIKATKDGYILHQQKFVEDLLKSWGMDECRPAATIGAEAMTKEVDIINEEEDLTVEVVESEVRQAQKLAGSLIWLSTRTRPDIAYAQGQASSWAARDPKRSLAIGKRILRYLAGTRDLGLAFTKQDGMDFTAYTDANFEATRSMTGSLITFGGSPLCWKSGRQAQVARSTADSELTALASTYSMAENVKALLESMGLPIKVINMLCDNRAAIILATGEGGSSKTKALMNRVCLVKEAVALGMLVIAYVATDEQRADCLTKFLSAVKQAVANRQLGLVRVCADT